MCENKQRGRGRRNHFSAWEMLDWSPLESWRAKRGINCCKYYEAQLIEATQSKHATLDGHYAAWLSHTAFSLPHRHPFGLWWCDETKAAIKQCRDAVKSSSISRLTLPESKGHNPEVHKLFSLRTNTTLMERHPSRQKNNFIFHMAVICRRCWSGYILHWCYREVHICSSDVEFGLVPPSDFLSLCSVLFSIGNLNSRSHWRC